LRCCKVFFEKIPVKTVTITQNNYLNELLLKIQSNVGKDQAYLELEQQVDIFLYKLYDLPYQDILLIDSRVGFTEKEFLSYILPK
jgi:hypothetical protein